MRRRKRRRRRRRGKRMSRRRRRRRSSSRSLLFCIKNAPSQSCRTTSFFLMKIYVHLDEDSTPLPPHTLKIDDASSLSVSNIIEQFCTAYTAKVKLYTNIRV
jgi:hypothetical protein